MVTAALCLLFASWAVSAAREEARAIVSRQWAKTVVAAGGSRGASSGAIARGDIVSSPESTYQLLELVADLGTPTLRELPPGAQHAVAARDPADMGSWKGGIPLGHRLVGGDGADAPRYTVDSMLGRGAHGQVWRARRLLPDGTPDLDAPPVVLKRIFWHSVDAILSGYREVHFGMQPAIRSCAYTTRLLEHWTTAKPAASASPGPAPQPPTDEGGSAGGDGGGGGGGGSEGDELWLAFDDAGLSLQRLLYQAAGPWADGDATMTTASQPHSGDSDGAPPMHATGDTGPAPSRRRGTGARTSDGAASAGGPTAAQPITLSPFWRRLRSDAAGSGVVRRIMQSLLRGIAVVHRTGAVHRDVKPANLMLAADAENGQMAVRLADFGSAFDAFAAAHLYPATGPTQGEETLAYAPPEVRLSVGGQPFDAVVPSSYDMFSIGVLWLEMLLGAPASTLFMPSTKQELLIRHRHTLARAAAGGRANNDANEAAAAVGIAADDEATLRRDLLEAGLHTLCVAPKGASVAIPTGARASTSEGPHAHHDSGHEKLTHTTCNKSMFRRLLLELDAPAVQRLRDAIAATSASDRDKTCSEAANGPGSSCATADEDNNTNTAVVGPVGSRAAPPDAAAVSLTTDATPAAGALIAASTDGTDRRPQDTSVALTVAGDVLTMPPVESGPARLQLQLPSPEQYAASAAVASMQLVARLFDSAAARAAGGVIVPPAATTVQAQCLPGSASENEPRCAAQPPSGDERVDDGAAAGFAAATPTSSGGAGAAVAALTLHDVLGCAGEDLLYRLLEWDPATRITAAEALRHPYFTSPVAHGGSGGGVGDAGECDDDD